MNIIVMEDGTRFLIMFGGKLYGGMIVTTFEEVMKINEIKSL
jgi:hypothetical protein